MAHLGYDRNEYGTVISRHRCDVCGQEFTTTPASGTDEPCGYPPNWDPDDPSGCASYDLSRDVSRMMAGGATVVLRKATQRGEA